MALNLSRRILLAKAAVDNGFDVQLPDQEGWLSFASSQAPVRLWLGSVGEGPVLIALSQEAVLRDVGGIPWANPLPAGAAGARSVADIGALHAILSRAIQLSRALPDAPLRAFEARIRTMPQSTEIERLAVKRVGQDIFREGLLDYWEGACALTGLAVPALLRASHIRPWADCDTDAQRLDIFNGLLLAAHLDAAFDAGLMTFGDDGLARPSARLDAHARCILGLEGPARLRRIEAAHHPYLSWHRERCFR